MASLRNVHFYKKPAMKPKKAIFDTNYGQVTVEWKQIDGKFEYSLKGANLALVEVSEEINHLDKWSFLKTLTPH